MVNEVNSGCLHMCAYRKPDGCSSLIHYATFLSLSSHGVKFNHPKTSFLKQQGASNWTIYRFLQLSMVSQSGAQKECDGRNVPHSCSQNLRRKHFCETL